MTSSKPKKYLIVGPAWVGDMVMAQSLFMSIKETDPNSTIDVLAPSWTGALIDRMPQVRRLIEGDFKHGELRLAARYKLGKYLREEQYTNCIVLPNSIKSAIVPAVSRIPIRTGFLGEQRWGLLNDIRTLDKSSLPMTVQRFVALGKKDKDTLSPAEIPPPKLQVSEQVVNQVLEKNDLSRDHPILILCPGAEFGISKKWPAEHYSKVALYYKNQGWQVWLMGSSNDLKECTKINELSGGNCEVLAGSTTLPEAIDLISCASLVVSNDSGLMHIAAALQKPLVAVYGSTDPGHTPPLSINHSIVKTDLECQPCHQRDCPLKHHKCMKELSHETILAKAEELLS